MSHNDSKVPIPAATTRHTRGSIRHSLNFASMGKAFAEAINRDTRSTAQRREPLTAQGAHNRRASVIGSPTILSDSNKPLSRRSPAKRISVDETTIRRTRAAAPLASSSNIAESSVDELGYRASDSSTNRISDTQSTRTRASSVLKPKNTIGSALPKYRPKSMIIDSAVVHKPIVSVNAGTRRKHRSSEEEKESAGENGDISETQNQNRRPNVPRTISPIPRRSASATPSRSVNTPPRPHIPRNKGLSPSPSSSINGTPSRPKKTARSSTSPSLSIRAANRISTSPKAGKHTLNTSPKSLLSQALKASVLPSPSLNVTPTSRQRRNKLVPSSISPSVIHEGDSTDSVGDVEFMLSAALSPSAPTPAIPRLRSMMPPQVPPRTPSRSTNDAGSSGNTLLVPSGNESGDVSLSPGQIVDKMDHSWDLSRPDISSTLTEDEFTGMISEVSAPFTPGWASPAPSAGRAEGEQLGSPSPRKFISGDYISISQVLLPTASPSPFPISSSDNRRFPPSEEVSESSTVVQLRLQLAAAESLANARLSQVQNLEMQMQAHIALRDSDTPNQAEGQEPETMCIKCRHAQISQPDTVAVPEDDPMTPTTLEHQELSNAALHRVKQVYQLSNLTQQAVDHWELVRSSANSDLDFLNTSREMLSLLLEDLEIRRTQLRSIVNSSSS